MKAYGLQYEIIVIDDCSTDNTKNAALLQKENATFLECLQSRKRLLFKKRCGILQRRRYSNPNSDGEHKPEDIPSLLTQLFASIDIVAGSRFASPSKIITTHLHFLGNILFNFLILILTGQKVSDSQTSFWALKRNVFDSLHLTSDGFEIEMEITIKCLMNGFTFKEVPVSVKRRKYSASKLKVISDGKKILFVLINSAVLSRKWVTLRF